MKTISIANKDYELMALPSSALRKVWVEAKVNFRFYSCTYKEAELCVLESKTQQSFTPRQLRLAAERLTTILCKPIVYLFDALTFTERNRLIDQNVYFVVSGKYVFLPNLLIAVRDTEPVKSTQLTPVAQWLLLAHLQGVNISSRTAKELADTTPFQYVTLTRAFRVLESLQLCHIETDENKYKRIVFPNDKRALWQTAQSYIISPIRERLYCDEIPNKEQYKLSGIIALSHYTALNPDEVQTIALIAEQWRKRKKDFKNVNTLEGNYCIEIWQYEPVPTDPLYVDKLSLAISIRDDHDPRIEKEVEQMIEQLW